MLLALRESAECLIGTSDMLHPPLPEKGEEFTRNFVGGTFANHKCLKRFPILSVSIEVEGFFRIDVLSKIGFLSLEVILTVINEFLEKLFEGDGSNIGVELGRELIDNLDQVLVLFVDNLNADTKG